MLERQVGNAAKVVGVLGIGQGITALDEIEPELVEFERDRQLVLEREIDPLALAAVAKRRVINLDSRHVGLLLKCLCGRLFVARKRKNPQAGGLRVGIG